jgi:predicted Rossmann fold flavoprotein
LNHELIIIGGGAAGLTAAVTASELGIGVAIVEGTDRIGKKLLTTGNGRCNISNASIDAVISDIVNAPKRYHSSNKDFFVSVLQSFTVKNTIDFFLMLGLPIITLDEDKMYPMSLQASSVLDIFRMTISDRNIPLYINHKVTSIIPTKQGFKVLCKTEAGEEALFCKKVILCTGGKSAPGTGSDGSGYNLVKALGHKVITPIPALVQLKLNYKNLKALSGIKFDGNVEIIVEGDTLRKEFGEILFTDYGISGPPVIQLSRIASFNLTQKKTVSLKVDLMPHMTTEELENFLEAHWAMVGHRSVMDSLIGIINKKLIPIILKEALIDNIHKPAYELDWKEKKALYTLLKAWQFIVTDTNSFSNAQVTAGGIDTKDINPITLESKIVPNLFFAGEIIDVDGDCGGYNLQWAWSSGYVAAKASKK